MEKEPENPFKPSGEALEHLMHAHAYREQNEQQKALMEWELAVQFAPDWAGAHYLRGRILESLSRIEKAREAFAKATSPDPRLRCPSAEEPAIPEGRMRGRKSRLRKNKW